MHIGRALVTGAANGIGRQVAVKLSEMGYELVLTSRNKAALDETASLCKTRSLVVPADLCSPSNIESFIGEIKQLDRLDVVFYSHGIHKRGTFEETPMVGIQEAMQLYLTSIIQLDKALLPMIAKARPEDDHISRAFIYMGSVSSTSAQLNNGTYAICKHALKAHADSLFDEIRESGVKVSTLFPGYINSRPHTHAELDLAKMISIADIVLSVEYLLRLSNVTCATGISLRPQFNPKLGSSKKCLG